MVPEEIRCALSNSDDLPTGRTSFSLGRSLVTLYLGSMLHLGNLQHQLFYTVAYSDRETHTVRQARVASVAQPEQLRMTSSDGSWIDRCLLLVWEIPFRAICSQPDQHSSAGRRLDLRDSSPSTSSWMTRDKPVGVYEISRRSVPDPRPPQ